MIQKTTPLTRLTQDQLDKIIRRAISSRAAGGRIQLSKHDLSHLDFHACDLSHADFTGSVLYQANLEKANLGHCIFFGCDLRLANFRDASLIRADLRGANLRGASMYNADLTDADLREGSYAVYDAEKGLNFSNEKAAWAEGIGGVDLRGANMEMVKLSGAVAMNSNFENANLCKAKIVRADLSGANLSGANLSNADLSQCELKNVNLRGANLVGVKMDSLTLVNVDTTGALTDKPAGRTLAELPRPLEEILGLHQEWLESESVRGQRLDLSGFDLRGFPPFAKANLSMFYAERSVWYGHDLSQARMQACRFKYSDMRNCRFDSADLRGSNFSKSNLAGSKLAAARFEPLLLSNGRMLKTNFSGADLRYTDFNNANLRDVDFTGADLSFSNFTGADIYGANFHNAVLEEIRSEMGKFSAKAIIIKEQISKE